MDFINQIPVLVLHVLEADIPKYTGIIDEDIDTAEGFNGSFYDSFAKLDAIIVGNRLSTGGFNLVNNDICGLYMFERFVSCVTSWFCKRRSIVKTAGKGKNAPLLSCPHQPKNHQGRLQQR